MSLRVSPVSTVDLKYGRGYAVSIPSKEIDMNLDAFMQVAPFAESIHVTVTQALHKHFEFDGYCSYDSVFDALCETFPNLSESNITKLMVAYQTA